LLRSKYAEAAAAPTTTRDTEDFQLRMRSVVRENAYEDIRAGRFPVAQRQLDRVLAITPRDPIAHTYYGDLHRLQAQRSREADKKAEHARLALASYERAVELDASAPEPHRQLGFLYYQQKDTARAKAAFEKYLALKPTAPDAKRIKEYLVELDR
jgi:regulator of sirC expression with transglutaminase-like and TPR domain